AAAENQLAGSIVQQHMPRSYDVEQLALASANVGGNLHTGDVARSSPQIRVLPVALIILRLEEDHLGVHRFSTQRHGLCQLTQAGPSARASRVSEHDKLRSSRFASNT